MPSPLPPQPALATDWFILILATLRKWVWEKPGQEMTGPVSAAIRRKLGMVQMRFASLAKRFHDGTLTPPKPRVKPPASPDGSAPRTRPPPILPRRFGWLCRLVPSLASAAGAQMERLLDDPELEAMAKASPEVGKLIRPLLWMTGRTPPAYLALPPRVRRARAAPKPAPARLPRAAPAERQEVPPPPPVQAQPAALLVTPTIDVDMWSHYSLIPGSRLKGR
jgi:hypothetical protein